MSAQVTEKHIDLVRCVLDAEWWGSNVEKKFAQLIADSEAKATAQLRADRDYNHECINRLASATGTLGEKSERVVEVALSTIARAERAEAELHALRLVCGTTDADKFSTWVDRANARAEEAEHDCRVLIVQLNVAKDELATEREKAERYRLASLKLDAELAAERAKVRLLHSALQNLADEQNGAPLEKRREEWQEAMDEACAALAATEETK